VVFFAIGFETAAPAIAISMIDQIVEESESRGGLDVQLVHLKLGVFSGVDKAALLFAYELACEERRFRGRTSRLRQSHWSSTARLVSRSGRPRLSINFAVRSARMQRRRLCPGARLKLPRWRLRHEHTDRRGKGEGAKAE
jgi:hypothetical protein